MKVQIPSKYTHEGYVILHMFYTFVKGIQLFLAPLGRIKLGLKCCEKSRMY